MASTGVAVKKISERFEEEMYPDDLFLLNGRYLHAINEGGFLLRIVCEILIGRSAFCKRAMSRLVRTNRIIADAATPAIAAT